MDTFDSLLRQALVVCALCAFPVLGAATLVGTAVAIAQAATQVQEQTLTLLPKLLVVGVLIVVFGHAAFGLCQQLFDDAVRSLPDLVRAQ